MRHFIAILLLLLLFSCGKDTEVIKAGPWRATLLLNDKKEIPFLLELNSDTTMTFINAEERIDITDVKLKNDSIIIQHPVFEGVIKGTFTKDSIGGVFFQPNRNRSIPITMQFGRKPRFHIDEAPSTIVTGTWETVFSPNNPSEKYLAKGVFKQRGNRVTGTFQTTTGDYRYLDGIIENDSLKLSTFDGAHAFLFEAQVKENDSVLEGVFYSGSHWKERFEAKRNEAYELPKADTLVALKKEYDSIHFAFPTLKGDTLRFDNPYFKDKVTLVQLMGSWCPNCLDETRYLVDYYNKQDADELAIVALAFEYAPTREKAKASLKKLKKAVGIPYPILLAQVGSDSKQGAHQKLPMLTDVKSYPTLIFIDKQGKVRKIHSGFNGPATGEKYKDFQKEFEATVEALLSE
ncbi:TlpA family protein disulfide reductase [Flavobacteriaceae bacterium TK19130]|nr:TlpA family protein disulfide reductase [Thermobacterium salinum]